MLLQLVQAGEQLPSTPIGTQSCSGLDSNNNRNSNCFYFRRSNETARPPSHQSCFAGVCWWGVCPVSQVRTELRTLNVHACCCCLNTPAYRFFVKPLKRSLSGPVFLHLCDKEQQNAQVFAQNRQVAEQCLQRPVEQVDLGLIPSATHSTFQNSAMMGLEATLIAPAVATMSDGPLWIKYRHTVRGLALSSQLEP